MKSTRLLGVPVVVIASALAACGGGGSSSSSIFAPVSTTASSSPSTAPLTSSTAVAVGSVPAAAVIPPLAGNIGATIGFPATTSGSGGVGVAVSVNVPSGATALSSINGLTTSPIAYVAIVPNASVSFATSPTFTFTVPSPNFVGLARFAGTAWTSVAAPVNASTAVTFNGPSGPYPLAVGSPDLYAFYAAASPSPSPVASATAVPSPSPTASGK